MQRIRAAPSARRWEAVRSEVRAAEVPRLALRSLSPGGGARDDDEAGKVRRARREAAWHAPCDRRSVFSAVAQTLLARRGYTKKGSPAAARCSSSPGRIRAPRPARTRPARPARPLRTLPPSPFLGPLSFLPFVCLSAKGAPARCKVLSRPGGRHPRDGAGGGRRKQECAPPLGLPTRRANSADRSGVVAAGVKSPRAGGGPGWWHGSRPDVGGWGWRSRLLRGRGAQGTRRCCCSCSRRSRRRRPRLSRRLH